MHRRPLFRPWAILWLEALLTLSALAQPVLLNEVYNSGGTDEWVEFLVLSDETDLRRWRIKDFTSSGNPASPPALRFSDDSLWADLRAGTLIVVGRSDVSFLEDTDPSDHVLFMKTNNATYMSAGTVFSLAGSSDAVALLDSDSGHVFGVSWGSANAASLPSPKIHFTGSSTSNTSISFDGDNRESASLSSLWTFNNSTPTPGSGNSPRNSSWITSLREKMGPPGTAFISPDTLLGGSVTDIEITYVRDTLSTVTGLQVVVPAEFSWSWDPEKVVIMGSEAVKSFSGDTVVVSAMVFSSDTVRITLEDIGVPDTTSYYLFHVFSKPGNSFASVLPVPRVLVFGRPAPIAEIKKNTVSGVAVRLGEPVTVQGIVTVAGEFGGPSFIQDSTAGLSIFGSSFTSRIQRGDEVIVSGVVSQFNGLNQIEKPLLHSIVSRGNEVEAEEVAIDLILRDGVGGVEYFEGRLVRLRGVRLTDLNNNPISRWGSGVNHRIADSTGTMEVRVDNNVDFANALAPQLPFELVGVVGQFKTSSPYIGGYQIMPRSSSDIFSKGPGFLSEARETNITPTSLTVEWTTADSGTSQARYGRTRAYELGVTGSVKLATAHSIEVEDLEPATMYYIEPFSVRGPDTSKGGLLVASTASLGSSGSIEVFFNKSIDASVALAETAKGNVDFVSKLVELIQGARHSIDVCLYSLSGTPGPGETVALALVEARNRGVSVRVIGEKDNQHTVPWSILKNNGIPVVDDGFDTANGGAGLMHNKFFVFDYRGGPPESVYVWTGSWNVTDPGTHRDKQNVVLIQDRALAGAYTAEFNEMWGSDSEIPDASVSRFGSRKTDNTPHRFVPGGVPVELYFGPTDRATGKILQTIERATSSVYFALLTFTRSDISSLLQQKHENGITVRGLLDNGSDQGSQFPFLSASGLDVLLDPDDQAYLHHKYALIDSDNIDRANFVITGSQNWTNSAEHSNNENTLIIASNRISNLFLQEFKARYVESGGDADIVVRVEDERKQAPEMFALFQNYPNPFNSSTSLQFTTHRPQFITLKIFDLLGREIRTLFEHQFGEGKHAVSWDGKDRSGAPVPTGVYYYRLTGNGSVQTGRMVLLR